GGGWRRALHRAPPRGDSRQSAVHDAQLRPDQAAMRRGGRARRVPRCNAAAEGSRRQSAIMAQAPPNPTPTPEEAQMSELKISQGTIRYRESGEGPPIVFPPGVLADGRLWRKVTPLPPDPRCTVPALPLGSHTVAMTPDADLSPPGMAGIVAGFLEALQLEEVTLVANDT